MLNPFPAGVSLQGINIEKNMKKNYQKPETISVDMTTESYILDASNEIGFGNQAGPSAAGESRGEWGNVWGK